jgi:hypothetical protein
MSNFDDPLKNIRIASPCSANWDEMYGNERKRFCGDCKLNVYNLSGMSRKEAEDLIRNSEGRLCVRFYRRPDGSILTQDCPVGWAKIKQRVNAAATAFFSLLIGLFGGLFFVSAFSSREHTQTVGEIVVPTATPIPTPEYEHLMGAVAYPTPVPKQTPQVSMGLPEIKGKPATYRK